MHKFLLACITALLITLLLVSFLTDKYCHADVPVMLIVKVPKDFDMNCYNSGIYDKIGVQVSDKVITGNMVRYIGNCDFISEISVPEHDYNSKGIVVLGKHDNSIVPGCEGEFKFWVNEGNTANMYSQSLNLDCPTNCSLTNHPRPCGSN
jgi:hypothetical protein